MDDSIQKVNYSLPLGSSTYDTCLCVSKCKTPCGRKTKPTELIYTASDFTSECTRFEIDLDQFDSVFDAAYVQWEADGKPQNR